MRIQPLIALVPALALAACGGAPVKPPHPAPPPPAAGTVRQAEAALAPASASLVSGRVVFVAVPGR